MADEADQRSVFVQIPEPQATGENIIFIIIIIIFVIKMESSTHDMIQIYR